MNRIENLLVLTGELDPEQPESELLLPDGRVTRIATATLLASAAAPRDPAQGAALANGEEIIPVVEETLVVGRRTIETGKVVLHKSVQVYETALDEPLASHTFEVERVLINQPVDTAPGVRQEGQTTIYPLLEEQLIMTKQLVLKEELRVTRRESTRRDTRSITLRRERMDIERTAPEFETRD